MLRRAFLRDWPPPHHISPLLTSRPQIPTPAHRSGRKGPVQPKTAFPPLPPPPPTHTHTVDHPHTFDPHPTFATPSGPGAIPWLATDKERQPLDGRLRAIRPTLVGYVCYFLLIQAWQDIRRALRFIRTITYATLSIIRKNAKPLVKNQHRAKTRIRTRNERSFFIVGFWSFPFVLPQCVMLPLTV